jgi:hypothetical protein
MHIRCKLMVLFGKKQMRGKKDLESMVLGTLSIER